MLDSHSNHCHEALDGLCMALLQTIIKKSSLAAFSATADNILTTLHQAKCHGWIQQIKTTRTAQQAGMCSVLLETAPQTLQITHREDASHCSSSGPQNIMHTRTPKSRASLLASTLQFLMNICEWGAAINMLYRVIVNSSSDQKALYRRALCYNTMITSYGNISKKGRQRDFHRAQQAIQFVLCLDFINQNPSNIYSTLAVP